MFNNLTNNLSKILRNIRNQGRLTEDNIKNTLRAIRMSLIEADVSLIVVREFIDQIKKVSLGQKINKHLTPGQTLIKIIHEELIKSISIGNNNLNLATPSPAIIMCVGLPGVGKTTTIAKLGKFLYQNNKKKVLVVSCDLHRPAALKQLALLAKQANIDYFSHQHQTKLVDIVQSAVEEAKLKFYDILLVDTPGFSYHDQHIIDDIKQIHITMNPIETFFVIDSMMGQDAANIGKKINNYFCITGLILTKVDSDARGGSVLSICHITGKPIKFIGSGENIESLEIFHPKRIASRILGMGDVLSLIEDIQSKLDSSSGYNISKTISNNHYDLNDFLEQLRYINNIGDIDNLINKLPIRKIFSSGAPSTLNKHILIKMESIIKSMTYQERKNPEIIKGSRKRRIACGSGTQVQDVNILLHQFQEIKKLIKNIKRNGISKIMKNLISLNFF